MVGSTCRSSFIIPLITQTLLSQNTIELIDAKASDIMDKILCHKYFFRIHCLAQKMLTHIRDSLFPQIWSVTQSPCMTLKFWALRSKRTVHSIRADSLSPLARRSRI